MNQKCYMCDGSATTDEHVPPKCLFPEEKDLPMGVSLRKNLITVRSCELHNLKKSKDDEYLLLVLCMNIANNSVAFQHFSKKIMRAYERRPALMKSIVGTSREVVAVDKNGISSKAFMVKADMPRIRKCLNQISRALYYYEFKKPFTGQCRFLHDWTIREEPQNRVVGTDGDKERNAIERVKSYFEKLKHKGENASVFRYRFEEPDERGLVTLSMQFYEGSNVFIAFLPNS